MESDRLRLVKGTLSLARNLIGVVLDSLKSVADYANATGNVGIGVLCLSTLWDIADAVGSVLRRLAPFFEREKRFEDLRYLYAADEALRAFRYLLFAIVYKEDREEYEGDAVSYLKHALARFGGGDE